MGGEASRINGRKGGGGKHKRHPEMLELRELCKRETPEVFTRLREIAYHGELETTRHAALCTLAAYGHGKPPQSITGAGGVGAVVLQISTGVNTPSDFGNWENEPQALPLHTRSPVPRSATQGSAE
jgi:hypothetical protein